MSGAGAVAGRAAGLELAVVGRAARGTGGFFSGTAPAVEEGVAALGPVVRGREAAVLDAALRVVALVVGGLGLAEAGNVNV